MPLVNRYLLNFQSSLSSSNPAIFSSQPTFYELLSTWRSHSIILSSYLAISALFYVQKSSARRHPPSELVTTSGSILSHTHTQLSLHLRPACCFLLLATAIHLWALYITSACCFLLLATASHFWALYLPPACCFLLLVTAIHLWALYLPPTCCFLLLATASHLWE